MVSKNKFPQQPLDRARIDAVEAEIQALYTSDSRPWVLGYSGGKDSTAVAQLVWHAVSKLPPDQRAKPIHILSSDTLVEMPVVVDQIRQSLQRMGQWAQDMDMPVHTTLVRPQIDQSFWLNLIGRGYPAPYNRFRWCTDRLKIQPANRFILDQVAKSGEVILALGTRFQESATRSASMKRHHSHGHLSRHANMYGAWVYSPIRDWSTDDVWTYLLNVANPWGQDNRDLVTMYRNAQDGECPLVVDDATPSCGNSRFGCWTCTVVDRDKSMEAMVDHGEEWLEHLLDFRDWLTQTRDPARKAAIRSHRRRNGRVQTWGPEKNRIVWGPYTLEFRQEILRRLLETERHVRAEGPDPEIGLISDDELQLIRSLWRAEESDWEDSVPRIVGEASDRNPDWVLDDRPGAGEAELRTLTAVCEANEVPVKLVTQLIDLERTYLGTRSRRGLLSEIDRILRQDWRDADEVLAEMDLDYAADPQEDEACSFDA